MSKTFTKTISTSLSARSLISRRCLLRFNILFTYILLQSYINLCVYWDYWNEKSLTQDILGQRFLFHQIRSQIRAHAFTFPQPYYIFLTYIYNINIRKRTYRQNTILQSLLLDEYIEDKHWKEILVLLNKFLKKFWRTV